MTLRLATEADLEAAIANGLLEERHSVDIKRELAPGPEANRRLAQDLAAFAIDGGQVVIGVAEEPLRLHPVDLAGLAERVESVGLARVDHPLHVSTSAIPAAAEPGKGYLVINVPASPMAPHMVDHVYYARNDKRNYRLSDPEVDRLVGRRRIWQDGAEVELRQFIDADPVPPPHHLGHLFVSVSPVAPSRPLLRERLEGKDWVGEVRALVGGAEREGLPGYSPCVNDLHYGSRTARGGALQTVGFGPDGAADLGSEEKDLARIELTHQGGVRIFCGRGKDFWLLQRQTEPTPVVIDQLIVGWCYHAIRIALALGVAEGFVGPWDFGIGITQLRGGYSNLRLRALTPAPAYSEAEYVETTRSTAEEMGQGSHLLTARLLGRLFMALDSRNMVGVAEFLDATHQD